MTSATTRVAAVIGAPVRHSLSPVLHNAAFGALGLDWVYVAFEVRAGAAHEAAGAMRALDLGGLSVTMPHKTDMAAAVDLLSPQAGRLRAVNCVAWNGEGRLIGLNTDGAGFVDALRLDHGIDPAGRRAVVLGAGGAARAVVLALAEAGCSEVAVVARRASAAGEAAALAGTLGRVADEAAVTEADLVVNATPVGMGDSAGQLPCHLDLLRPGQVVADLVYHPLDTALLQAARARGATGVDGLGMLVHQAAHQLRQWTGADAPVDAMRAAAERALRGRS